MRTSTHVHNRAIACAPAECPPGVYLQFTGSGMRNSISQALTAFRFRSIIRIFTAFYFIAQIHWSWLDQVPKVGFQGCFSPFPQNGNKCDDVPCLASFAGSIGIVGSTPVLQNGELSHCGGNSSTSHGKVIPGRLFSKVRHRHIQPAVPAVALPS